MAFTFVAKKRGTDKPQELRASGLIPAVLYGSGEESVSLMVDYVPFKKLYNEAGESSLIDLSIDGGAQDKPVKVLIQELQYDPVKGNIIHIDFRRIDMNKEMHATLELNFINESPAVKELGGTLMKTHDTLDIKCLPKDLVAEVNVDLGILKTFSDVVHVKDLVLPDGIKVLNDLDLVIAKVAAPLTEEQLKAMEETTAPNIDQIEVEKKGKEEVEGEGEGEKGEEKVLTGDKKQVGEKKKE